MSGIINPLADAFQQVLAMGQASRAKRALDLHERQIAMQEEDAKFAKAKQLHDLLMVANPVTGGQVSLPGTGGTPQQAINAQDIFSGRVDPLAGLPGMQRAADPGRTFAVPGMQPGQSRQFEFRDPTEVQRSLFAEKVRQAEEMQRVTGVPVETPQGIRHMDPDKYHHYAQGRLTEAQLEQLQNEPVMTVGEIRSNPGSLRFRASQMGSAGSLLNATGVFDKPKQQFVTDNVTGDVRMVQVDKDGNPSTIQASDWKGIGRPRPRGAGGSGDLRPNTVLTREQEAEELHAQRVQLGEALAVADGDELPDGKVMTKGLRAMYQAKYNAATNKLRNIEKLLGRPMTEDSQVPGTSGPVVQPGAAGAAQPQAAATGKPPKPNVGDTREYQGDTYRFDGTKWVEVRR